MIDTAVKRYSALQVKGSFRLVIPDGTVGGADRQTLAGRYGGILSALKDLGIGVWAIVGIGIAPKIDGTSLSPAVAAGVLYPMVEAS